MKCRVNLNAKEEMNILRHVWKQKHYNLKVYDTVSGRDPAPDNRQFIMFLQLF